MTAPTPAVRAALVAALVVLTVGVSATAMHLIRVSNEAEAAAARGAEARATTLAAALASGGPADEVGARFAALAAQDWPAALALLDADGSVLASSDAALAGASPWARTVLAPGVFVASRGGVRYAAVARPIGETGQQLGVVQIIDQPGGTWGALGIALGLLALVLAVVGWQAWYAGPRVVAVLSVTAERMAANRDGDPRTQVEAAERVLGPLAATLKPLARRMMTSRSDLADATKQVAALLQINPHYVLIATFDGEIIEANPAFYAATGLSSQVLRGGSVDLLRDVFPLQPLLEWADRSDREGSSIGGIEYALVDSDGRTLPVVVSLRAVTVRRRKAVLIQATDVAARKRLERQVAAFSDTLELMVDQRVSELDGDQSALHQVLDRAGVLLASFDDAGYTLRWNGAAETFSGRMQADVPHIHQAATALGIAEDERPTFISWFWNEAAEPLVLDSTFDLATGASSRRILWRIIRSADAQAHRTLVGIEVPETLDTRSAPEATPPRRTRPPAPPADDFFDDGPSPEAIAEEEAWIRRLASAGTDAFGGKGPHLSNDPPGGGSWISRGLGLGSETISINPGGDGQSM